MKNRIIIMNVSRKMKTDACNLLQGSGANYIFFQNLQFAIFQSVQSKGVQRRMVKVVNIFVFFLFLLNLL